MLFLLSFWFASHVDMREDLKVVESCPTVFFPHPVGTHPHPTLPQATKQTQNNLQIFPQCTLSRCYFPYFQKFSRNPFSVTEAVNPLSIDPNERVTPSGHTQHNGESSILLLLPWIVFKYLSYRWSAWQPGGDWDRGDPPSPHVLLPLSPNQTHPPTSQGAQSTPGKIEKTWTYLSLHSILTWFNLTQNFNC